MKFKCAAGVTIGGGAFFLNTVASLTVEVNPAVSYSPPTHMMIESLFSIFLFTILVVYLLLIVTVIAVWVYRVFRLFGFSIPSKKTFFPLWFLGGILIVALAILGCLWKNDRCQDFLLSFMALIRIGMLVGFASFLRLIVMCIIRFRGTWTSFDRNEFWLLAIASVSSVYVLLFHAL